MSYKFLYTFCSAPDEKNAMPRTEQRDASSIFQQYKKEMKAKNDNLDQEAEDDSHMIEIGVTDDNGKPMETYTHQCVHTRG